MRAETGSPANGDSTDMAAAVRDLSRRLDHLVPGRRDPERFHREKSELVNELRQLADSLRSRSIR